MNEDVTQVVNQDGSEEEKKDETGGEGSNS